MKDVNLYNIDMKYIRDLHNADSHVLSVSPQVGKSSRPFVGIIVILDEKKYCIPLTSPKEKFDKKSNLDFIKIFDDKSKNNNGAPKVIGILNINNMIPVDQSVVHKVDLIINKNDIQKQIEYKTIMQKQLRWCRENVTVIENRANKVYDLAVNQPEKNRNLTRRCLQFSKLETVLEKYISAHAQTKQSQKPSHTQNTASNQTKGNFTPESVQARKTQAEPQKREEKQYTSLADIKKLDKQVKQEQHEDKSVPCPSKKKNNHI